MSRRRSRPAMIGLAIASTAVLLWVVSLAAVVFWEHRDQPEPAGAIVVLGAAQYVGHPSPVLRARLDHAIALWRLRPAPNLIVPGGKGTEDTTTEAEVSERYALQ